MRGHTGPARDTAVPVRRAGAAHLTVVGLGHHGLGLAAAALRAGFLVTCIGPAPWPVGLITGLAADDARAAPLDAGRRAGTLEFRAGPRDGAAVDIAVFAPAGPPDPAPQPGPVELAAAALAPALTSRSHLVVFSPCGLLRYADLVTGTIGLLTGLAPGPGYLLGFGVPPRDAAAPTVVSGVDAASVARTATLFGDLGRATAAVTPPAAAEFVGHLQNALVDGHRRGRPR